MDIVERLQSLADCDSRAGEPLGKAMRESAAEIERLRAALTGIKRAGKARMASYGDEHSYYYFTACAALTPTALTDYERKLAQLKEDFPNGI